MKIINRYIVREFLRIYFISLGAVSGLYIIVTIFESLRDLFSFQPSVYAVIVYYATQMPGIIYQTIPMAALLSAIILYAVMSRNNEVGSLLAAGISPWTIVKPSVIIILILSLFQFALGEYVVPRANIENAIMDARIHRQQPEFSHDFKVTNIWFRSNDDIYRVGLFVPWLDTIKDITIYTLSDSSGTLVERTDIGTARWDGGPWNAENIYTRNFGQGQQMAYSFSGSAVMRMPFTLDDFMHTGKTPDEMGYAELRSYIQKLKQEGYTYAPYDVDLNSKLSYPLSSLFVVLLVIPFSLKKRKASGMMLAIGISLAVGFSYWIVMALSLSMGNSGILGAVTAAWLPNIITSAVALGINGYTRW